MLLGFNINNLGIIILIGHYLMINKFRFGQTQCFTKTHQGGVPEPFSPKFTVLLKLK